MNPLTLNRYAYTGNNPIMYSDPSGHSRKFIGGLVGAVAGAIIGAYTSYRDTGSIDWGKVGEDELIGASIGVGVGDVAEMITPGEDSSNNYIGYTQSSNESMEPSPNKSSWDMGEIIRNNIQFVVKKSCEGLSYIGTEVTQGTGKNNIKTSDLVGVAALETEGVLAGDDVTGIGVADDVLIPVVGVVGGLAYIGTKIYEKVTEKAEPIVIENEKKQPTVIYRWGSGSNTNLTPRPQDAMGLSFSTIKPPSGSYVVTTIEQVNATGVLVAIKDGPTHVSVVPVDISTMPGWIESRPNAETNPHPLTQTLKTVAVKP